MSGYIGGAGSKSGVIGITELDYEEGTWTPTITGSTSGSGTAGTGYYTKVGKTVTILYYAASVSFPTYVGYLYIDLPFAAYATGTQRGPDIYYFPDSVWENGISNFCGVVPSIGGGSTTMSFNAKVLDSDRQLNLASTNTSSSGATVWFQFSFTYYSA